MTNHSRWRLTRERELVDGHREAPEVEAERQEHRLSMALAKAVYDRRIELGLSQTELATRCGLTQAKVSRIEGCDTVPTLPLLTKLARGLDAPLNIAIDADGTQVTLTGHQAA